MNVLVLFRYGFSRWMSARQTLVAAALLKLRRVKFISVFKLNVGRAYTYITFPNPFKVIRPRLLRNR